jgi:hypothetical protein
MRKASQDNGLIINDDKFIGIALGYDYCAEHEWGIKDLKRICEMPEASKKNMGIKNRTITKCPPLVFREETHKNKKFAILYSSSSSWQTQEELEKYLPDDFKNWTDDLIWNEKWNTEHPSTRGDKDNISTAWDGGSFGVAAVGDKEVEYLKELYEALRKCNIVIAVANLREKNPFAGSSLCLLIADRVPQTTSDAMYAGDKEYFDREDYEEKIGMKKIITKYGNKNGLNDLHYFMACSPKWIDYDDTENREKRKKELNTKYDIQYWINYSDSDNNAGWYTVEEIKEWLTGNKKLTEIHRTHKLEIE